MKKLWRAWDSFFFSRFDPYSLGLLRIFTGVLWLVLLGFYTPNWGRFFAADGIAGIVDMTRYHDPWSLMTYFEGTISIDTWWWIGLVVGLLYVIGFCTRTMTIGLWLVVSSLVHRQIILVGAEDLVLRMVLFWCMFMPLGREWSVDAWLRRRRLKGRPDPRPLPMIWATRMLQLNIACFYLFSLPMKLTTDPAWLNGDAFFFSVINDTWARWPWPWMFYPKWMSMLGTYGAIAVEASFPILVWTRWRLPMVIAMVFFHVMLALMLENVTLFSMSMAVTYWVFIPGETSRAWVRALFRVLSTSRTSNRVKCLPASH